MSLLLLRQGVHNAIRTSTHTGKRLPQTNTAMIQSIEELQNIPSVLTELEEKRLKLFDEIKTIDDREAAQKKQAQDDDDLDLNLNETSSAYDLQLVSLSEQISAATSIDDLNRLCAENANLKELAIVKQLTQLFNLETAKKHFLEIAQTCDRVIIPQIKSMKTVPELGNWLQSEILENINYTAEEIEFIQKVVSHDLSSHIVAIKNGLVQDFKKVLLDCNWDNEHFNNAEQTAVIKNKSGEIYELCKIHHTFCNEKLPIPYWNFEAIANNFKIKFIYHFNNNKDDTSQSIETFFKFLESYLNENLYKCMYLFTNESIGLGKLDVHDQFINHVLEPLRNKIMSTINKIVTNRENLETLVRLITQIFITDENLWERFSYNGDGLITLLPNHILKKWIQFETDIVDQQYRKNFSSYQGLNNILRDGPNFVKYLTSLYKYFHPFLAVNNEKFFQYKIMVFKKIFLNLLQAFRESNMNYTQSADETELVSFEENVVRLQNMHLVFQTMYNLEKQSDCVILNVQFNKITDSDYKTLFQAELLVYKECMQALTESLIHRFKKMFGHSLRTYFKVGTWSNMSSVSRAEGCSNELIPSVSVIKRCVEIIKTHMVRTVDAKFLENFQLHALDIVNDYLMNYVIKLNKFSDAGYWQLMEDHKTLRSALGFSEEAATHEDASLMEVLMLYRVICFQDTTALTWLNKNYLKYDPQCARVKEAFCFKYANVEDLSYFLYKLL